MIIRVFVKALNRIYKGLKSGRPGSPPAPSRPGATSRPRSRAQPRLAHQAGGRLVRLADPVLDPIREGRILQLDRDRRVGVGAMDYPAEFAGASEDRLAELGVGKLVTLTSTYDHRVIQGAESGEFLRDISQLLIDDKFWDEIFRSLRIPFAPLRWAQDEPNTGRM